MSKWYMMIMIMMTLMMMIFQALDNMSKWCNSAEHHLSKDQTRNTDEQDLLSQIRQIEYLMSKVIMMMIINSDNDGDD